MHQPSIYPSMLQDENKIDQLIAEILRRDLTCDRFAMDQIVLKKNDILLLIKDFFGGNIGYRKSKDTYYYESSSFGTAKNFINYFNYFNLLSSKHVNYLKWRKAYLIVQNRDHLTKEGIDKIVKLKKTMNSLSNSTV